MGIGYYWIYSLDGVRLVDWISIWNNLRFWVRFFSSLICIGKIGGLVFFVGRVVFIVREVF